MLKNLRNSLSKFNQRDTSDKAFEKATFEFLKQKTDDAIELIKSGKVIDAIISLTDIPNSAFDDLSIKPSFNDLVINVANKDLNSESILANIRQRGSFNQNRISIMRPLFYNAQSNIKDIDSPEYYSTMIKENTEFFDPAFWLELSLLYLEEWLHALAKVKGSFLSDKTQKVDDSLNNEPIDLDEIDVALYMYEKGINLIGTAWIQDRSRSKALGFIQSI